MGCWWLSTALLYFGPVLFPDVTLPLVGASGYPPHPRTPNECPTCSFNTRECDEACSEQTALKSKVVDFHYNAGECWEDIPVSGHEVITDFDLHCGFPDSKFFLACQNMHAFSFSGISLVEGCGSSRGSLIADQTCDWTCKHKRPVARCRWNFTHPVGDTERLEMCWISETCLGGTVMLEAACQPHAHFNATEDLAALRKDLEAAKLAHRLATSHLEEAYEHNATMSEELEEVQAAHELAEQQLAAVTAELDAANTRLKEQRKKHAGTHASLQASKRVSAELSRMLDEARVELVEAKEMSTKLEVSHTKVQQKHSEELRDLLVEVNQYKQVLEFHNVAGNASQIIRQPQNSQKERTWLISAVAILAALLVACTCMVVGLAVQHKNWQLIALSGAQDLGADVVLGRPVGSDNCPKGNGKLEEGYPVKPTQETSESAEEYLARQQSSTMKIAWA